MDYLDPTQILLNPHFAIIRHLIPKYFFKKKKLNKHSFHLQIFQF